MKTVLLFLAFSAAAYGSGNVITVSSNISPEGVIRVALLTKVPQHRPPSPRCLVADAPMPAISRGQELGRFRTGGGCGESFHSLTFDLEAIRRVWNTTGGPYPSSKACQYPGERVRPPCRSIEPMPTKCGSVAFGNGAIWEFSTSNETKTAEAYVSFNWDDRGRILIEGIGFWYPFAEDAIASPELFTQDGFNVCTGPTFSEEGDKNGIYLMIVREADFVESMPASGLRFDKIAL